MSVIDPTASQTFATAVQEHPLAEMQFHPGCARSSDMKKQRERKISIGLMHMNGTLNTRPSGDRPLWTRYIFTATFLFFGLSALAVPPPTGVAPVTVPAGGFAIDGDLLANTPNLNTGDWLPDSNGVGGVLDAAGNPLNPTTTFHFTDLYNSTADNTFSGGKWVDSPASWSWTTSK